MYRGSFAEEQRSNVPARGAEARPGVPRNCFKPDASTGHPPPHIWAAHLKSCAAAEAVDSPLVLSGIPAPTNSDDHGAEPCELAGCFHANPEGGYEASNNSPQRTDIFVNGMSASERSLRRSTQVLSNIYGAPMDGVFNPSEINPLLGVANGFMGMLSSSAGRWVEREAVENVMTLVESELRAGRNVRLHAHSQGAIIMSNALEELQKKLGSDEWNALLEQAGVEVLTYGALMYRWPKGVQVTSYVHTFDIPALGMGAVSYLRNLFSREHEDQRVVRVPGFGHNMPSYLSERAYFFVAEHLSASDRKSIDLFVGHLLQSITDGALSDRMHEGIIRRAATILGRKFHQRMLDFLANSTLGGFHASDTLETFLRKGCRSLWQACTDWCVERVGGTPSWEREQSTA